MAKKEKEKVVAEVTEEVVETVEAVEETPVVEETTEEVVKEEPDVEEEKPVKAKVLAKPTCAMLNVRAEAKADAEIISLIDMSTKVAILEPKAKDGFFKVQLETGLEGYCMAKFLKTI